MKALSDKVKKVFWAPLNSLSKAYVRQRERELTSSRDKWKKKAMDRQSIITELEKELKQTKDELKKTDF